MSLPALTALEPIGKLAIRLNVCYTYTSLMDLLQEVWWSDNMQTYYKDDKPFVSMHVVNVPQYHCSICGIFFTSDEPADLWGNDHDVVIRRHFTDVHKKDVESETQK